MRTSRPKTPVTYGPDETFPIGGSKMLRQSGEDVATVVGAGVTVFEALKAYDQLLRRGRAHPRDRRVLSAADRRERRSWRRARRRGAGSSPSRITIRRAGSATRSARPWRPRASRPPARGPRDSPQRPAGGAARSLRHLRPAHRRGGEGTAVVPTADRRQAGLPDCRCRLSGPARPSAVDRYSALNSIGNVACVCARCCGRSPNSTIRPGFMSTETTAARPVISSSPRSQPDATTRSFG